jgi:L-seryl-tRNA(Ser) seleniumtransferase
MHPPSVDTLARSLADTGLPHLLLVDVARQAIASGRADDARHDAEHLQRTLLQPVINATGTLLHTNLGRAPLTLGHRRHGGATNLEFDLISGERGHRDAHVGALLAKACGAQAATVVNNGAAAVLLVLAALARGRGVVVSRGELVEIGGGFRIPEVLAESGCRLVEVGTTNRTRGADVATALDDPLADVALVLSVHPSNYRIVGFTESVSIGELAAATGPTVPVVADLGSGLLDAGCGWLDGPPPAWLRDEPAARQTLAAGADLVTFSGDKLLGGPQAGIIAGRADLVAACATHPLARALRPGGLVLDVLHDTALAYLRGDGRAIPFWRMATTPVGVLHERADRVVERIHASLGIEADAGWVPVQVVRSSAVTGGGTLPGVELDSVALFIEGDVRAPLRATTPPVITRMGDGGTLADLRTVEPTDDDVLADAMAQVLRQ